MIQTIYDVIIVGGGPAGLTAAIYACRARLNCLLMESNSLPTQAMSADFIENYPGFPQGISGFEFIERLRSQGKNFGLQFITAQVQKMTPLKEKDVWQISPDIEDQTYQTKAVILAVGRRPKLLGVPGEEELRGKGVSYCAVCDGAFFKDKDIVVVGGGDAAVQEALYLTRFARKVILVHRRNKLRATPILQERARCNKKIEFLWDSVVTEILGKDYVQGVYLKNLKGEAINRIACQGVFISVSSVPNTDFLKGLIELDDDGYIVADEAMRTSQPGIFACGDCRDKPLRQIVTACGDGAVAAFSAIEYVDEIKGRQTFG